MLDLEKRDGNDALRINGPFVTGLPADIAITTHGSDFYFAICAAMGFSSIVFLVLANLRPPSHRIFHWITSAVTMVATIAYFCMGSNLGWTSINVEFRRSKSIVNGLDREIFYVRYIDWFVTTPLLLLDLLLTAGMPWPHILWVIFIDEVMIVTGLIGALVSSTYKWGFFAFGCAALLYILYQLVWESRIRAYRLGDDVGRAFVSCGSLTAFLWLLYPVAFGLSEGGNLIAPDSEAIFYGILDLFAKPMFGYLLIFGHRNIDPARLGVLMRDYEDDPVVRTGEKPTNGTSAPAEPAAAPAETA